MTSLIRFAPLRLEAVVVKFVKHWLDFLARTYLIVGGNA
jgi:hypothetical protein